MPTARVKPDAEAVAVAILRADAALDAFLVEAGAADPIERVSTELPAPLAPPHVRVWRVGGNGRGPKGYIDRARLQGDGWGRSKREASTVAREALRALLEGPSSAGIPAGVVVTNVEEDLALQWAPDPTTGTARYLFGVVLTAHGAPL